jgi:hypothetical protein
MKKRRYAYELKEDTANMLIIEGISDQVALVSP